MHEELVDTLVLLHGVIILIDAIAVCYCIYLAHVEKGNNAIYRIGLVLLSFGLLFQIARSFYMLKGWDLPHFLGMGWALKDIGIFLCLTLIVLFKIEIRHNKD